ncbi:MAG: hypothetical protein HZA94_00455 [Candidatus Vogelbacteria bacterium]|nr:hypothetical protein [Candidatus Vogelbacteria bacterium]
MQHPLNSIEWAEYKKVFDHWSDLLVAGTPVVFKGFPVLGKLGMVYLFPIIEREMILEESMQKLFVLFKQSQLDYLLVKPFLLMEQKKFCDKSSKLVPRDLLVYQLPKIALGYKNTYVVDLTIGLEACFKNFSSTKRNEIRRIEKSSDISIQINEGIDWDEFYYHYSKNMMSKNAPLLPKERVNYIFKTFHDKNNLLLIKAVNKVDGARFYTCCLLNQGMGLYLFGSYDRSDNLISKMVPKYTLFLAMKKMAEMNYSYFDLGGIDLADPRKSGINDFKKGFGGISSSSHCFLLARRNNRIRAKAMEIVLKLKGA